jgi:hypothetical protein
LEASAGDEAHRIHALSEWVRRRPQQIDALINLMFLDLSARSAEVEFEDKQADPAAGTLKAYRRHLGKPELRFWSIDTDKDRGTRVSRALSKDTLDGPTAMTTET